MIRTPVLHISDPHFHNFKMFSTTTKDGINSRLNYTVNAWLKAVDIGLKNGCKVMTCSGDIFHVRGHLRPSIYNVVYDLFAKTVNMGMEIVMIAGNHDFENYYEKDTAIDKLHWIDGVHLLSNNIVTLHGNVFAGIPYCHNTELFKEKYLNLSIVKVDYILTHQYIDDYLGIPAAATGLSLEFLTKNKEPYTIVVNGHSHTPENEPTSNVIDVGAPMGQSFSDTGIYGCWITNVDDDSVEMSFEEIPDQPRFITIEKFPSGGEGISGNYVRIKASSAKDALKMRTKCEASGAIGIVSEVIKGFKAEPGKSIKIGSRGNMLAEYIDIMDGAYKANKVDIMKLYDEVCS